MELILVLALATVRFLLHMTSIRKPSILIIGGAGYIGSTLARMALSSGYNVKVLDQLFYGNLISLSEILDHPEFSFIKGDFCDLSISEKALQNVDAVVLLAALVGDPISKKYPEAAKRINEEGPKKLFDLMKKMKIGRFVFTSTCSNYGLRQTDEAADESAELNPQSLYAECKVAVEKYLLSQSTKEPVTTILRLATAYGLSSRMRFDLTISEFTRAMALNRDLLVYDENTWRPYCHVWDICRAILMTLEASPEIVSSQVFNVGSNSANLTKRQIVELISKHTGTARVEFKQGGKDPRNYRVSFDKITKVLGYQTQQAVDRSIKQLVGALQLGAFNDSFERKNFYENYSIPLLEKN